jgi:hypothetical protein
LTDKDLLQVQKRRALPTRLTQSFQLAVQNRVIKHTLERNPLASETEKLKLPLILRLTQRFPAIRRLNARLVGLGFRPEHVRI